MSQIKAGDDGNQSGMEDALEEILDTMNVPEGRKKDYPWLSRNLGINNGDHPHFYTARALLRLILRRDGYYGS